MSLHWIWILLVIVLGLKWLGRWWVRRCWQGKVRVLLGSASGECPGLAGELESLGLEETDLPAPVARYLRTAIPADREVRVLRLKQEGRLRTDPGSQRWMDFEAEQIVVPGAPGFVWNARVALGKWMHVGVLDSYVEGQGVGQVSLQSAIPLGREQGGKELNEGALHRYLAEGPWCPSSLRPSDSLRWTAIDESRALATLVDRETTVSLEFWFGESGEIEGIYTPGRWARRGKGYEMLAWEGHFHGYEVRQGLRIPMAAEVGWYVDGQWKAVWEGRIREAEFAFDRDL